MRAGLLKSCLISLFIFSSSIFTIAQNLNLQSIPGDKNQIGLGFLKPFYNSEIDISTEIYELNFNIPVSSKLSIIGNIPFLSTYYEVDFGDFYNGDFVFDEEGFGNIFLGLQTNSGFIEEGKSIISFGVFLPTADDAVVLSGATADYYYLQKYLYETLGIYFNYAYFKLFEQGFNFGFEAGPNVFIPVGDNEGDTELMLHLGFNSGFRIHKFYLNAEYNGMVIISEDFEDLGDRFINSFNIGAQWKESLVTPKVFYKLYLDEMFSEYIDGVLGIDLTFTF